jgi:hypothetical protein
MRAMARSRAANRDRQRGPRALAATPRYLSGSPPAGYRAHALGNVERREGAIRPNFPLFRLEAPPSPCGASL